MKQSMWQTQLSNPGLRAKMSLETTMDGVGNGTGGCQGHSHARHCPPSPRCPCPGLRYLFVQCPRSVQEEASATFPKLCPKNARTIPRFVQEYTKHVEQFRHRCWLLPMAFIWSQMRKRGIIRKEIGRPCFRMFKTRS